jgi:hypothetical protein
MLSFLQQFTFSRRLFPFLTVALAGLIISGACQQAEEGDLVPLPTSVCLQTMHHDVPVPEVNVFFKFNCDTFPGYYHSADWFDTLVVSNEQGQACIAPVPPGKHWAVAFGVSEHGLIVPIFGRMPFEINLENRLKVDTFIYLYE